MIIGFLQNINSFNEQYTDLIMKFVQFIHIPVFFQEAVTESINLIPFLFIIFLLIEIFENYFSDKIEQMSLNSRNWGPLVGSFLASVPQCGFSVIATVLYAKRFITLGTLIAIYISTSDEAIPILLVHPENFNVIIPVIITKITIGILSGYIIDFIIKPQLNTAPEKLEVHECGCCHHEIKSHVKNLLVHPLKHSLNIFIFILIINCCLAGMSAHLEANAEQYGAALPFTYKGILQVIVSSLIGLIPNCAASVMIVMLYLKHFLTFGALIAGLCSNAGLGLLVLLQNDKSKSECFKIAGILFVIAVFCGTLLYAVDSLIPFSFV